MKTFLTSKEILAAVAAAVAISASTSHAADIFLQAGDGFGASSFSSAGNWSNGAAPSAGNDYFVNGLLFRTPASGGDITFQGDSLTIVSSDFGNLNHSFMFKGPGYKATVNNLILDGGNLRAAEGDTTVFTLGGSLHITGNGATMHTQGGLVIESAISGSGLIRILDQGNTNPLRTITFTSGDSTYNGNIVLAGSASNRAHFQLASSGVLNFAIGSNGVNNSISGVGTAAFNGVFLFDLSGASSNIGDSWTIASVSDQSFGGSFSVAGFADGGNGLWTSGNYQFDQATGVLEVIPEPSTYALLFGLFAAAGLLVRRRSRNA